LDEVERQVTVSVFASGTTASKTIELRALRVAASLEIPTYTKAIADEDQNKYIPIVAKDSQGNVLTAQEIVDNYEKDRFRVYATGPIRLADPEIKLDGDDKGKIHISNVRGTGSSRIEISLKDNPQVSASTNISVGKERYPERITWATEL